MNAPNIGPPIAKSGADMTREAMIGRILQTCAANNVYTDGDLFFSLAFRTESQLRALCRELHINTK